MKPLPKAPLTKEDVAIIESRWYYRGELGIHPLWYVQWRGDSRDAELMWGLANGACPVCLGEIAHTVECVGWWCDVYRANAIRRRLGAT
jgi:hypothetical protein